MSTTATRFGAYRIQGGINAGLWVGWVSTGSGHVQEFKDAEMLQHTKRDAIAYVKARW